MNKYECFTRILDKTALTALLRKRDICLPLSKKKFSIKVFTCIIVASIILFLSTDTASAQGLLLDYLVFNPFILDNLMILSVASNKFYGPFSLYANDQYSSYNPFGAPYESIISFPSYFGNTNTDNFNPFSALLTKPYNPVSFLNSTNPVLSFNPFPSLSDKVLSQSGLTSLIFQPIDIFNILPINPFDPRVLFGGLFPF